MELNFLDVSVFLAFIVIVIGVGIFMSRQKNTSEDYFLAGRGLSWWLIGFSLIAANISTEQFVGMSGSAANYLGLAIASYEWMAAITLVVVAFVFLPKFLQSGIYTIPEYLEHRYNAPSRTLMSLFTMIIYVAVTIPAVIYSGALTVDTLFHDVSVFGIFSVNLVTASWVIGILAAVYVVSGGLKACAWADLLQGSALIVGGGIVVVLAMKALGAADPESIGLKPELADAGAITKFRELNSGKLHMVLPINDTNIPWTALVIGLWIPNFYYWGLNQYITQRTLGSKSLSQGQKGVVFAAALKLIIPFIIVVPGIIAFNLYKGDMQAEAVKANEETLAAFATAKADPAGAKMAFSFDADFATLDAETAGAIVAFNSAVAGQAAATDVGLFEANKALLEAIETKNESLAAGASIAVQTKLIGYQYDSAFALLLKRLIPAGLRGFMLAAILGAVMSSLASMLNAASTIFTMDLFKKYMSPDSSQGGLVLTGRACVVVFVVTGCVIAPFLGHPDFGGIFKYIQEFQGFISPGILAVFVFGLIAHRAPPICGVVGLLLNPVMYGLLKIVLPGLAFLDRMAVTFFCVLAVMAAITMLFPTRERFSLPTKTTLDLTPSKGAKVFGIVVVLVTLALYAYFW